jgi:plastocyanin
LTAQAGTVTLRVELINSRDAAVTKRRDFSGVVAWLEPVNGKAAGEAGGATMIHRNKTFVPHVQAIRVGTKVAFPNQDPFFHNAFSNYDGQLFDIGLHPPGTAREVLFRRAGIVRVFCNIHPTMSAVLVVVDTPYFAASDAKGALAIPGVPAGEYTLRVFHERARAETLEGLKRRVTIGDGEAALPALTISEEGFLPAQHKNKYGKEYPAVIEDRYPGKTP